MRQFRNNGTSLITVEGIELSASKLVQTYRTHASFPWTIKRPLMHGRALGHLTEFRNFGTLITFERTELSASNLVDIQDGSVVHVFHKTTLKWACPGSIDPISKFLDP